MQLTKRPATEADIPFLTSLRRETMDEHLAASGVLNSDEHHVDRVMKYFDCAMVLILQGEPVGLLKVIRQPDTWEIIQIQLATRLHGMGLGRSLVEGVIAEATAAGAAVKLSVLKANPARHLYERLGFTTTHEDMHEYYMHRAA